MLRLCASIENLRAELDVFFEKKQRGGVQSATVRSYILQLSATRGGVAPKGPTRAKAIGLTAGWLID